MLNALFFGAARIELPSGSILTPAAERVFSLTLLLTLSPRFCLSVEELLKLVWYEMSPEKARHTFRQQCHHLRKHGVRITVSGGVARIEPSTIARTFCVDPTSETFTNVIGGSPSEPIGQFLEGWVHSSRQTAEAIEHRADLNVQRAVIAIRTWLSRPAADANYDAVKTIADRLIDLAPYSEELAAALAAYFLRSGHA